MSPDERRAYDKRMEARHRDTINENKRVWRQKNRDKTAEAMKRLNAKPERMEYNRVWQANKRRTDPCFRLASNLRSRMGKMLRGKDKGSSLLDIMECSIDGLRSHIEKQFRDGMSWQNYGEWEVDHIKPLKLFDLTDPIQLKLACALENLQPLWAHENRRKWVKYGAEDVRFGEGRP